jgi:hypothetical protein
MRRYRWLIALRDHLGEGLFLLGSSSTFVPWPWPAKGRAVDSNVYPIRRTGRA